MLRQWLIEYHLQGSEHSWEGEYGLSFGPTTADGYGYADARALETYAAIRGYVQHAGGWVRRSVRRWSHKETPGNYEVSDYFKKEIQNVQI